VRSEIEGNAISNLELQNLCPVTLPTTTNLHGIFITHEISTLDSKKHFSSLFMDVMGKHIKKVGNF